MTARGSRPWRLTATLALLIYVGLGVVSPLVHAEREVLWTQPSYESHHTDGCRVIHSDAGCPSIGHFASPELASRRLLVVAGVEHRVVAPASERPAGLVVPSVQRTRAPPIPS